MPNSDTQAFVAEDAELLVIEELTGFGEHLSLFFLGMMLNQLPQHFGLGAELGRFRVRGLQLGQHHVDDVMLFRRLVEKIFRFRVLGGLLESRVKKLFLNLRMNLQLPFDLPQKPLPLLDGALRRSIELSQEPLHRDMIRFQQSDCIGHRFFSF